MTGGELTEEIAALGEPAYRAAQVAGWVWRRHVTDFASMTNLPARLREALAGRLCGLSGAVERADRTADGTDKLLLRLVDGEAVECVAIPTARRLTACVSTQVGCAMNCVFCATGLDGLVRNLTAGEIVEQVFHLQAHAQRPVTNVVFMGMGEPLANYDAAVSAVRAMVDPDRLDLSARHVTVSTVGLPAAIRRLAAEDLPITLAISLHAPDDALRARLMPAAARAPLADVLDAAAAFYNSRHREVTLEYTLLAGENDSLACADALARIAGRLRCNVNVIPYNPVPALPYRRPSPSACKAFLQRLRAAGVNANLRRPRGVGASAACGQLSQSAGASR